MKNAIQFGAGNIGRGFIGAVLRKSSYNVLFCDVNREIIDKINENQNIAFSQKTIDLLAMLQLKYLANEEEKELLKDTLDKNDIKYQTEMRRKYNPDNLFKNKNSDISKNNFENENDNTALVEVKEKSLLQRIFDTIKNFFRK